MKQPGWKLLTAFLIPVLFAACAQAQMGHVHQATSAPPVTVTVETAPAPPEAGREAALTVRLTGPMGAAPEGLAVSHERLAHFLLVSQNLEEFHHLHAEDFGASAAELKRSGVYPLRVTPRLGGGYRLGVDLLVGDATVVILQPLNVTGSEQTETTWNFDGSRKAGGLDFALSATPAAPRAGERVDFSLRINEGGKPAAGLKPYLGAAAHIAAFPQGAATLAHLHGESGAPSPGGAADHSAHAGHGGAAQAEVFSPITFSHAFPAPGSYRLWVQVNNGGEVLSVPFDVKVAP